ncbi:MAG: polymorphic toxin type 28 domain-containing protein [Kineosporiaceae bacterium]
MDPRAFTPTRRARPVDAAKEHTTPKDLDAARRERAGEIVARRSDGRPFDHVTEVVETQQRLLRRIGLINRRLGWIELSDAERARLLTELADTSRLLDHTEGFVPRP